MKHCFFIVLLAFAVVSCSTSTKYNEQDFIGLWVEPIPGMTGVQGVALEKDGKAHSINMATLCYESWKYENGKLILNGTSVGNKVNGSFTDTLDIVKLTADSLQLTRGNYCHNYIRSKEECGFSANPGETTQGVITFGHETRTFRPKGSDTVYWLVDKSGYLMQKYKESGLSEWKVTAELEVKNIGKRNDGFAKDYSSTYEVLRVIKLEK